MLSDLQSSWLLLLYCAEPRANHLLRNLPPSLNAEYAQAHDEALWQCLLQLLGEAENMQPDDHLQRARRIATLPAHMGGLGLRSAALHAPAAYWAGWADALLMLSQRRPAETQRITQQLMTGDTSHAHCLERLRLQEDYYIRKGFH